MTSLESLNRAPLSERILVLCEGIGDAYFINALAKDRAIGGIRVVWPEPASSGAAGLTAYPAFMNGLAARPGFEHVKTLVATADNDDTKDGNFKSVRSCLAAAGFPVPDAPKTIEVAKGTGPHAAIIMFPDTGQEGALESLLLESCNWSTEMMECLTDYCACTDINSWPKTKQDKARLRCVLAASSKKDPERSWAYVWGKADSPLDVKHSCFDQLAAFLRTC